MAGIRIKIPYAEKPGNALIMLNIGLVTVKDIDTKRYLWNK